MVRKRRQHTAASTLDTFPIVRRRAKAALVLAYYNALAASDTTTSAAV